MITLPFSYYFGGDRGTQTLDLSNANAALYQLSYIPMLAWLPSFVSILAHSKLIRNYRSDCRP